MNYPAVLYNPQRPNAGFTHVGDGWYATPTPDEQISYESLMEYIQSATGTPSAETVSAIQAALNKVYSSYGPLNVSGQLDSDTAARVAEYQLSKGMIVTGVPTGETLAALEKDLGGGGSSKTLLYVALAAGIVWKVTR